MIMCHKLNKYHFPYCLYKLVINKERKKVKVAWVTE